MSHLNYVFNSSSRSSNFPNVTPINKTIHNADGSVSVIDTDEFDNPYNGLSAESFTLESQLDAGVRLTPSPKNNDISIGRVDSVTSQVKTVIEANENGIKLNSKNSK